ncbi:MAG TPA: metallophosphoesterase family protein [Burkholderiaceae bacterium]|nr:metallophosphoesterase family protein [Burkholderiaceae bacterium]
MKTALVTDLHANREAVEAVLAHAREQGVQEWVFLGDFVGYGADPAWVVDLIREHAAGGAVAVQGNHDLATVLGANPMMRIEARAVIEWTRAQLDEAQLEFLRALPLSQRRDDRLYVHANAYAPDQWEYLINANLALRSMLATECRYTFCGHLHEQRLFHAGAAGRAGEYAPKPGAPILLRDDRQWLVIPGSSGQPRDGNPAAAYAVFDRAENSITYHRVPYDHATAADKIRAAGLPLRLAARLLTGH